VNLFSSARQRTAPRTEAYGVPQAGVRADVRHEKSNRIQAFFEAVQVLPPALL